MKRDRGREGIYFDYAATTPVHPEVIRAMEPYLSEIFGNPSSPHSFGQEAKAAVEEARAKVAQLIGAREEEVIFTSGGTEANNLALYGVAYALRQRGNHIITSSIEHHSVLEACNFLEELGLEVTYLPVDGYGLLDPEDVRKAITPRTVLISIMHANNEVGTIEPIREVASIAKEYDVYLHTDAVQTVGHIPVNVDDLGVDLMSISAHKLYGPKGVGALYVRKGLMFTPFVRGGGQEKGRRAGTENVPGIVGFGRACELALQDLEGEMKRLTALRDGLIRGLLERIKGIHLNGHPTERLPGNVNVRIDSVEAETLLLNLDLEGIAVSTGSACSSGDLEPSHVLLAMGCSPEEALSALRLSLGRWTTQEEIDRLLEVLPPLVQRLRAMRSL